ncbi:hypothetical protein THAR02_06306 [Trichoderma harzianum]|uniref:Uncharacterized protein n=1 Tax=Trichoderma harzianum TaxID=5544 RepID=A0A0F9XMW8_TRIHA|nr:hypothetical protein THAR02_06306 [Trichoderma harzianum]
MRSVNPYSDTVADNPNPNSTNPNPKPKPKSTPQPPASRLSAYKSASKRPATNTATTATARLGTPPLPNPQGSPLIRPPAARQPNQHVLSVRAAAAPTTRSSTKRDAATMPLGDKPRQPQLSAAPPRSMTRTPLTPKVAVKGPSATTPLARKSGSSVVGAQSPHGESAAAPPASYLSHTVTPRSAPRQSRADSVLSAQSSTVSIDKSNDGWETRSNRGLGMSPLARTDSLTSRKSIGNSSNGPDNDSKFFYASSIKPAAQAPPPRPASVVHTKSTPTFFYASDAASKRVTSPPAYPSSSTHSLSSAQEGVATKFFYANGTPDVDNRLSARSSGSGSTVSSGSKATRPNTSNSSNVGSSTTQHISRPVSPSKNLTHPTLPQQQHHKQHPPPPLRGSAMSPSSPIRASAQPSPIRSSAQPSPKLASTTAQANKRRVSIEAPLRLNQGHGRTGSVQSIDGVAAPKLASPTMAPPMIHAPEMTPPLLSPALPQLAQPVTMASILQMADELDDEEDEDDEDGSEEGEDGEDGNSDDSDADSISRKRSSQNSESLNHFVLSARRERKVQDLEITNASLEAINKTLERQLRKQSAELRRFRRLSRAGRLTGGSAASTQGGASLAAPDASGGLTDVSEKEEEAGPANHNDEYEDDEDEEEEEEEDEDEDSLVDSELSNGNTAGDSKSNGAPLKAESAGDKRRKRDERRLQLDLTRHQELLLDSQKMNQSLKKCLNWTDLLIKEGQKALAYRVRIADVDAMPGRVLAASYYDYGDDTSQVEEDTISTVSVGDDTVSIMESEAEVWPKESQDRDSGIELPVAGH